MEIEFIETKDNPLLDRIEIRFRALHPGEPTVTREAVREKIASLTKSSKEKVIIDHMTSKFGLGQSVGYAKVYRSVEDAMKHERKHLLVRHKLIEPEKKAAAPAPGAQKPAAGAQPAAGEKKK